jgi:hypothetical protein
MTLSRDRWITIGALGIFSSIRSMRVNQSSLSCFFEFFGYRSSTSDGIQYLLWSLQPFWWLLNWLERFEISQIQLLPWGLWRFSMLWRQFQGKSICSACSSHEIWALLSCLYLRHLNAFFDTCHLHFSFGSCCIPLACGGHPLVCHCTLSTS